jgi:hypothetical protein
MTVARIFLRPEKANSYHLIFQKMKRRGMRHFRTILSLSLLVIIIYGFFACGGGGDNAILPAPTATVTPASPALINGSTSIVIAFDTSMNSSTLSIGGSLAAESDGGIWSDTVSTNDTLTISPATTWNDGAQVLTVDVNSAAGTPLATLSLSYTVDANLPLASISPPDDSLIADTADIVVTYSETMDTSSLIPSGTMWSASDIVTWNTTNSPDDTLTISPATVWPLGGKTLVLSVNDQADNDLTVTLNYTVATDNDDDGSLAGPDCDDGDQTVYPGAPEFCDGVDNDCDGVTDESFPQNGTTCDGPDSDLCFEGTLSCVSGSPVCSDNTSDTVELCNGVDDNCDGMTDEDFTGLGSACGTGACGGGVVICVPSGTSTTCSTDANASSEFCDGVDNDCDGQTDESLGPLFPLCENQNVVCAGSVKTASLCQGGAWLPCDTADYMANNSSYESAEVTCDGLDNDCDGTTDEGCP